MSNIRLEDIAKKLDISVVTVSNALAGRKGVSEELREEIAKTAEAMGYRRKKRRDRAAAPEGAGAAWGKRIVVLTYEKYIEKYASFYWELYQRTAFRASRSGCVAMLEIFSREMEEKLILPSLIEEKQVDGVIVLGKMSRAYLKRITDNSDAPVVLMDFNVEDLDCDAVVSNSFYGMYTMTNYLFRAGHSRIAFVGSILATDSIMDRYQGYCKSLIEHGVEERADWILPDRDPETGEATSVELPEDMPTAFACNSDYTAAVLAYELEFAGYSVPEDISVVSYDDYLAEGSMKDRLTTYAVDMEGMANRAIKFLTDRLENGAGPKRVFTVDGHVVERSSVGRPKA